MDLDGRAKGIGYLGRGGEKDTWRQWLDSRLECDVTKWERNKCAIKVKVTEELGGFSARHRETHRNYRCSVLTDCIKLSGRGKRNERERLGVGPLIKRAAGIFTIPTTHW